MPAYYTPPRYDSNYEVTFNDRLANFLLGMSALAGQSQHLLRQNEMDEAAQQTSEFNLIQQLAKLQQEQEQFDAGRHDRELDRQLKLEDLTSRIEDRQARRNQPPKRDIRGDPAAGFYEFFHSGPPTELSPPRTKPTEKKRDIRGDPEKGFYEFGDTGGPTELSSPREKKEPMTAALAHLQEAMESLAKRGNLNPSPGDIGAELRRLDEESRTRTAVAGAQAPYVPMTPGTGAPAAPSGTGAVSPPQPGESAFGYKTRIERTEPTAAEKNRAMAGQTLEGIVSRLEKLIDDGAFAGVGEGFLGRAVGAVTQGVAGARQSNQALELYESMKEGILANPVRFFGDVGTLNEGDILRARSLFGRAKPGFEGSFNPLNWVVLPDTPQTARNKLSQLRELIAEIKARPENRSRVNPAGEGAPKGPTGITPDQAREELRRRGLIP